MIEPAVNEIAVGRMMSVIAQFFVADAVEQHSNDERQNECGEREDDEPDDVVADDLESSRR